MNSEEFNQLMPYLNRNLLSHLLLNIYNYNKP